MNKRKFKVLKNVQSCSILTTSTNIKIHILYLTNKCYIWLADKAWSPNWSEVRWNFIKFEKKEWKKEENKHKNWKVQRIKILLGRTLIIQSFCHAKKTFSKHRLIKISTTHVHMKPGVKKWYNSNGYNHKWKLD